MLLFLLVQVQLLPGLVVIKIHLDIDVSVDYLMMVEIPEALFVVSELSFYLLIGFQR